MKREFKFLSTLVICAMLFAAFSPAVALADPVPPTNGDDIITGDEYTISGSLIAESNGGQSFSGGDGNDTLIGDNQGIYISFGEAQNGNDTIYGDAGNDLIIGDAQTASINSVLFNNGADTLYGGDGNDTLIGDIQYASGSTFQIKDGSDLLYGGDGDDTLYGDNINSANASTYIAGDDLLNGGKGNDTMYGGAGTDTVEAQLEGNQNAALTDSALNITDPDNAANNETDTLDSIEKARLLGSDGNNTIDAYDFPGTAYMEGGDGNDVLIGSNQDDELHGGDGDDSLDGFNGNDILNGGNGNDVIMGGNQDDVISGGSGNDFMSGGEGNDTVSGDDGDDTLYGSEGNDLLNGGNGNDDIYGGDGIDTIEAELIRNQKAFLSDSELLIIDRDNAPTRQTDTLTSIEQARLFGGDWSNYMTATLYSGTTYMDGGDGNDQLYGSNQDDELHGGNGDDLIDGYDGDDSLFGEDGRDMIFGGAGNDTIAGGNGEDNLNGGSGNDTFNGGLGDDNINGDSGIDTVTQTVDADQTYAAGTLTGQGTDSLSNIERLLLTGGDGNNTINVSTFSGDATINGEGGNDTLTGGNGNDTVDGGSGYDVFSQTVDADQLFTAPDTLTGQGTDTLSNIEQLNLIGGDSDNTIDASAFTGLTYINGGSGNDTLIGGNYQAVIYGGTGDDTITGGDGIDVLMGEDGNDTINGGAGVDYIIGGSGNDTIDGSAGNDAIIGEAGDDVITSNAGDDLLIGGEGNDTIIFGSTDINTDTEAFGNEGQNIFRFEAGTQGHYELTTESEEDTLDFSNYDQSVNIDLSNNSEQEVSSGLWLTLNGFFRNLFGSEQDDILVGNSLDNNISANGGNDQLDGNGGTNILNGGEGIDEERNPNSANTKISIELPVPSFSTPTEIPLTVTPNGTIPVTGGDIQNLRCLAGSSEVILQLSSGDQVRFIGLCDMNASLEKLSENALPIDLPTDSTFVTNLLVQVTNNGTPLNSFASGSIEISFVVPTQAQGKSLSLLHWDETSSTWTEIQLDSITTNTATATIQTNISGLFVLVEN